MMEDIGYFLKQLNAQHPYTFFIVSDTSLSNNRDFKLWECGMVCWA